MDAYALGQFVGTAAIVVLIAWLVIRSIVKVTRYNIIRKRDGEEAAQQFWNAKKRSRA